MKNVLRGILTAVVALAALHARAAAPPGRYVISNGTVRDTVTGLTWQQAVVSGTLTWPNAQTYCPGLTLGGFSSGWRLPTVKELASLVDVSSYNPAIDGTAFPNTPSNNFWTSTLFFRTTLAWWVNFSDGTVTSATGAGDMALVRCVR